MKKNNSGAKSLIISETTDYKQSVRQTSMYIVWLSLKLLFVIPSSGYM